MNTATSIAPTLIRQIHSLTPMRGIAAIWVMLFHIDVSLFYRDFGALLPRDQTGLFSKGYLWVDFFFLLSGFVIAHVYSQKLSSGLGSGAIKNYLWARFARIYPLHLFTLIMLVVTTPVVAMLYPAVVDGSWKTYFAWSAIPSNLLLTQSMNQHVYLSWNMVSWSIAAEWWTYVLSIPCVIFIVGRKTTFVTVYALVAFILLVALVYLLPDKNLDITFNCGFFRCLFEFNIGLAIYQLFLQDRMRSWLDRDWVAISLLLIITLIFHARWNDLLVIPCFSLLILALAYNHTKIEGLLNKPIFQYLGKISYSIYMVHCLWFMVFWFLLPQLKVNWGISSFTSFEKLVYASLFVGLTLISSHFTHYYIELKAQRKLLALFK
jgi:peptidoglycan/LPS O-acetylase OafA/YrhL